MSDIDKHELLESLGYAADFELLEACLIEQGLTNPRKKRISLAKREKVRAALEARFLRVCNRTDCRQRAAETAPERRPVAAADGCCEICGGSAATNALADLEAACRRAGWRRLCVVGGSPNARAELKRLIRPPLKIRLIDGTVARTQNLAKADLRWADHVVLWGSTQLQHKVSEHYQGAPNCSTVIRRSVEHLLAHLAEQARRAAGDS